MSTRKPTVERNKGLSPQPSPSLRRAFMLERAGNIDAAHQELLRLMQHHRQVHQPKEALTACKKALSLKEDADLQWVAAELCLEQERESEAYAHLQQALGLTHDVELRLSIARRMARIRPNDMRVFRLLSKLAGEAGLPTLAERAEARAVELKHRAKATVSTRLDSLTPLQRSRSVAVRLEAAQREGRHHEMEDGVCEEPVGAPEEGGMKAALSSPAGVVAQQSLEWVDVSAPSTPKMPATSEYSKDD